MKMIDMMIIQPLLVIPSSQLARTSIITLRASGNKVDIDNHYDSDDDDNDNDDIDDDDDDNDNDDNDDDKPDNTTIDNVTNAIMNNISPFISTTITTAVNINKTCQIKQTIQEADVDHLQTITRPCIYMYYTNYQVISCI